jgi:hypothetical protein
MSNSTTRQHAEDLFKRIQKSPAGADDRCDPQAGSQDQESKTARLRKLRLAKEASETPPTDRDRSSR